MNIYEGLREQFTGRFSDFPFHSELSLIFRSTCPNDFTRFHAKND